MFDRFCFVFLFNALCVCLMRCLFVFVLFRWWSSVVLCLFAFYVLLFNLVFLCVMFRNCLDCVVYVLVVCLCSVGGVCFVFKVVACVFLFV